MVSLFKEIIHQLRAGGVERITGKDGEHGGNYKNSLPGRPIVNINDF